MKLDLNFYFLDLDGNPMDGIDGTKTIAQTVAFILATTKTDFDPVDAYDFALTLRKEGVVELKSSDVALLEKTIRNFEPLYPLCKAQIIKAIHSMK